MESVDSTYGCVLLRGRVCAATKNWWSLHPDEASLLALYAATDAWATVKDTPVFLPVKSPTVSREKSDEHLQEKVLPEISTFPKLA